MYVRTVYATGDPALIDGALDAIREAAPRLLATQAGYRGYGLFADRELGKIVMGSWWDTQDDQQASDERLREERAALLSPFAGTVTTDTWEAPVFTPPTHAGPGAGFRMVQLSVAHEGEQQLIDAFRETVLTRLRDLAGFESASLLLDRAAGRCAVGVIFSDRAALVASRGPQAAVRSEGVRAAGVTLRSLEEFEVVLLDRPGT
jgi:heme-degrading monooxygenase HmoA